MENKYYVAYENYLYKFDYINNTYETWKINEHNLKCEYNIQYAVNANDLDEWFDFLQNTCHIPYRNINEEEFNKLLDKFQILYEMQTKLIEMKLSYAEKVKEYINLF